MIDEGYQLEIGHARAMMEAAFWIAFCLSLKGGFFGLLRMQAELCWNFRLIIYQNSLRVQRCRELDQTYELQPLNAAEN